jgi:hypothetical protein
MAWKGVGMGTLLTSRMTGVFPSNLRTGINAGISGGAAKMPIMSRTFSGLSLLV